MSTNRIPPHAAKLGQAPEPGPAGFSDSLSARLRLDKASRVSFSHALLERRKLVAYVAFRLRYFLLNNLALVSLRLSEMYYLTAEYMHTSSLRGLLVVRITGHLAESLWWGALEPMREQVRCVEGTTERARLARLLGRWQMLALAAGSVALLGALLIAVQGIMQPAGARLTWIYVAAMLVEHGVCIVLTTRRAGIGAMHRIPRPAWAVFAAPLAAMAVLVFGWRWLGGYALAACSLVASLLGALIGFSFTRRACVIYGWPAPARPTARAFAAFVKGLPIGLMILSGCAYVAVNIENAGLLLVLLLVLRHHWLPHSLLGAYLVLPLFRACHDWARLFYIDLKRFDTSGFSLLMRALETRFLRLSPLVGVVVALPCAPLILFLEGAASRALGILLLVSLFMWHAQVAWLQMILFCRRQYLALIACGLLSMSAIIVGAQEAADGELSRAIIVFVVYSLILATSVMLIWRRAWFGHHGMLQIEGRRVSAMCHLEWFRMLVATNGATRLIFATIVDGVPAKQRRHLVDVAFPAATGCAAWMWLDCRTPVGFCPRSGPHGMSTDALRASLAAASGGLMTAMRCIDEGATGAEALAAGYRLGIFFSARQRDYDHPVIALREVGELMAAFAMQFPDGRCLWDGDDVPLSHMAGPKKGAKAGKRASSPGSAAREFDANFVLRNARQFMMMPREMPRADAMAVSVTLDGVGRALLFCIPVTRTNRRDAMSWREGIYARNVRHFLRQHAAGPYRA